jgi:(p)ppGpp synthase/HD superfamily hydrolase
MMKARTFAARKHAGQKYGEHDYLVHLDEVVAVLREFGYDDPESLTAGWLHDVMEDQGESYFELEKQFGAEVAQMVLFVTDAEGPNRKERKAKTMRRIGYQVDAHARGAGKVRPWLPKAVRVKLADRIANVRACVRDGKSRKLRMYRKEHPAFHEALFVEGWADRMWDELNGLFAP